MDLYGIHDKDVADDGDDELGDPVGVHCILREVVVEETEQIRHGLKNLVSRKS